MVVVGGVKGRKVQWYVGDGGDGTGFGEGGALAN